MVDALTLHRVTGFTLLLLTTYSPTYSPFHGVQIFFAKYKFFAPSSLKRAAEVGEDPEREHINAQEGLEAGDRANPAGGPKIILPLLEAGNPSAHIELSPADIKGGEE